MKLVPVHPVVPVKPVTVDLATISMFLFYEPNVKKKLNMSSRSSRYSISRRKPKNHASLVVSSLNAKKDCHVAEQAPPIGDQLIPASP